jgi:diguanylate cyclase (GGDEF)-like protein
MTSSLRQRLLLVVMLPAAMLAAGIAGLFVARGTQAVDEGLRDRGLAIVSFLAPAAEYGVISGNRASLAALLQAVFEQRDVAAVAVYDRGGEALAVSGRLRLADTMRITATGRAQVLSREQDRLGFAAPVLAPVIAVDDLGLLDFGASDAAEEEGTVGWVYVELDTLALDNEKRAILLTALALALCGLGFTAWLALRMAAAVASPVARLADAVGGMARGRLDIAVSEDASVRELRVLQRGFNTMANAIADAHHTLQAKVDEATAQLAHQATHDPLTGLPNRRAFEQALEASIGASRRFGDRDTLCFIDLDRFKIVNDTCGHAAGDELLRRIADLIRHRVRADDLLCRIGGDEFALILRGCGHDEARRIAENLREAVAALRFTWEGRRFTVGASVGLARIDGRADTASDVLVAADLACYAAKKGGRNRVVEHERDANVDEQAERSGPASFGAALDTIPFDRLRLHGRVIVPVRAVPHCAWHEVLLRVVDDAGQACSPRTLLDGVAGSGAGLALDLWVAEQACVQWAATSQPAVRGAQRMSLNVTADSLVRADDYFGGLAASLRTHGLAPAQVVLEFPVALAERCPAEATSFTAAARVLGCEVALERLDGGSIGCLRSLRPDYAKISFKQLVDSYGIEAACNLAQALCGMASALGIATIASETEDELFRDALPEYGFDFAQGRAVVAPAPLPPPDGETAQVPAQEGS